LSHIYPLLWGDMGHLSSGDITLLPFPMHCKNVGYRFFTHQSLQRTLTGLAAM